MNWALIGFGIFWLIGSIFGMSMEGKTGVAATTLSATMSVSSSTATVSSTRDFPAAGYIVVDEEMMQYTGTTSTTFTGLTRGVRDTKTANHSSGQKVYTEISGLVNLGLDFSTVQSNIPLVGPVVSLGLKVWTVVKFIGKIVIWDWPYFDVEFLGFPLYLVQLILSVCSVGFLLTVAYQIKQVVNPFS